MLYYQEKVFISFKVIIKFVSHAQREKSKIFFSSLIWMSPGMSSEAHLSTELEFLGLVPIEPKLNELQKTSRSHQIFGRLYQFFSVLAEY